MWCRGMDGVVPLTVEGVRLKVHECELLVRDTAALGIDTLIDSALDQETGFGSRGADQVHDDLMGEKRLAAPVERDEREQSMLDLVPLAGTRWKVAHRDRDPKLLSEAL